MIQHILGIVSERTAMKATVAYSCIGQTSQLTACPTEFSRHSLRESPEEPVETAKKLPALAAVLSLIRG